MATRAGAAIGAQTLEKGTREINSPTAGTVCLGSTGRIREKRAIRDERDLWLATHYGDDDQHGANEEKRAVDNASEPAYVLPPSEGVVEDLHQSTSRHHPRLIRAGTSEPHTPEAQARTEGTGLPAHHERWRVSSWASTL